jgi:fluoroquinolone resistance protein
VDFTDADISQCVFDNCDLLGSIFKNTNLEKADLITASNYSIDPELNRLKKAKFSQPAVVGLLDKYDIIIK